MEGTAVISINRNPIEALADTISTDYHPLIGRAKDLAAGAVLFAALTAALIGLLIFIPKVSLLLK